MARPQRRLLLVILLAAALPQNRLHRSLWSDEAVSWWFARMPPGRLFCELCDPHPPGYYLLLSLWQSWGRQELWLRLPSLGAALLAIALTYRLGQAIWGQRCAAGAAVLIALHPLQSWYGAEARMYALVQCLSLLMVWAGWHLMTRPPARPIGWPALFWFGLAAVAAFGADYGALLPFGLLQLLWLGRGRPHLKVWLGAQGFTLALAGLIWLRPAHVTALQQGYVSIFVAIQVSRWGWPLIAPETVSQILMAGLGTLGLVSFGLAWLWPRLSFGKSQTRLWDIGTGLSWLLLLALAAWPRAYTLKRQLVVLLPYLALVTAYFLNRRPMPWGPIVAGLGLVVTTLILPRHPQEPWRTVVADLVEQRTVNGPAIWVDELALPAFTYYFSPENTALPIEPDQVTFIHKLGQTPLPALPPGQTLWVITAHKRYRDLTQLLPLDFYRYYQLQAPPPEIGLGLYRYQRRPSPLAENELPPSLPHPAALWSSRLPSPLGHCPTD